MMKRLLTIGGEPLRHDIVNLKKSGLKTEPAIAKRLNLSGDPYQAVLNLESKTDKEILDLISLSV